MAEETDEGIAYLRALKQPAISLAASAVAPAREPAPAGQAVAAVAAEKPNGGPPYHGAEKRRSSRYQCQGSVEMREEGRDVRTWATCTDISIHGCYVEAQATYPAGTVLHLKIDANDVRVECKGSVRVNYPYLGMGIAFVEVSEENQTRLKELLGAVSHSSAIMGPKFAPAISVCGPPNSVPLVSDSAKAVQALIAFFDNHHMLTREDFLSLLARSQVAP